MFSCSRLHDDNNSFFVTFSNCDEIRGEDWRNLFLAIDCFSMMIQVIATAILSSKVTDYTKICAVLESKDGEINRIRPSTTYPGNSANQIGVFDVQTINHPDTPNLNRFDYVKIIGIFFINDPTEKRSIAVTSARFSLSDRPFGARWPTPPLLCL